jgi:translation initiation factor IF-3
MAKYKPSIRYKVNLEIKAREVRLIDEEGTQVGVFSKEDALAKAKEAGVDLLLISDTVDPPVCKLINFGQFKYELRKKQKQNKRSSKKQVQKELKISPNISENDKNVRMNHAIEFLKKGYKVKVTLRFKGRQIVHPEIGTNVINKFVEDLGEFGTPEGKINSVNRIMTILVNPKC